MDAGDAEANLEEADGPGDVSVLQASHPELGKRYFVCEGEVPLLFTENETNTQRLFNKPNPSPYVKDGINNFVVNGQQDAVNPFRTGTKAAAHYQLQRRRRRDEGYPLAAWNGDAV